jgi:hypothetical protein
MRRFFLIFALILAAQIADAQTQSLTMDAAGNVLNATGANFVTGTLKINNIPVTTGGGGGSPGGLNTQLQFNNAGAFGGITNVTSDGTNITALTLDTSAIELWGTDVGLARNAAGILEVNNGIAGQPARLNAGVRDSATNTPSATLTLYHQSTATPVAGFGTQITLRANSATVADQTIGTIGANWIDATDATRSSQIYFQPVSNGVSTARFRIFPTGGANLNNTFDPGAGVMNVQTGFTIGSGGAASLGLYQNAAGVMELTRGPTGQWASLKLGHRDASTTIVGNGLTLGHQSTGTPGVGLGEGILFNIDSTTTPDQNAARISGIWSDPTDATRSAYLDFQLVNNAAALATKMRLFPSGGLAINGTTDPGASGLTLGGVAVPTISSTNTFTNKRLTPRVTSITSNATPTINTDNCDAVTITAQAVDITSMTTNLTGTPNNFDRLIIRIKDNGTGRFITWGASFTSSQTILPVSTQAGKVLTVGFMYDSVKVQWVCLASDQEP